MGWNNIAVTDAGNKLLSEVLYGRRLTITKAVGGFGTVEPSKLTLQTDLVNPTQVLTLLGMEDREEGKLLKIQVRNTELTNSYLLQQIAVFARLGEEETETLLFLMQDDRGVEIPSADETPDFLFEIYAAIGISNKANISLYSNPQAAVSSGALEKRLNSFLVVSSEEPTAGPVLWFDTSIMQTSQEVVLQLGDDNNAAVTAVMEGDEYAVENADV